MATLSSKVTPSGVASAASGDLANSAIQPSDTQSQATWEAGTGTSESLVSPAKVKAAIDALASGEPTTAQVLSATAGATQGAVGTYADVVSYMGEKYFGDTVSGSTIRPVTISKSANVTSSVGTTVAFGSEESSLSGTWRLMSSARYSGTRSYGFLALRIS